MSLPSFCNVTRRVARKRHTCTECGGSIDPLESYEHVAGCWDGEVDTYKTCALCEEARDFYVAQTKGTWMHDPNEGDYRFGQVMSELLDLAPDIPLGTGARFKAYRFVITADMRREAAMAASQ